MGIKTKDKSKKTKVLYEIDTLLSVKHHLSKIVKETRLSNDKSKKTKVLHWIDTLLSIKHRLSRILKETRFRMTKVKRQKWIGIVKIDKIQFDS